MNVFYDFILFFKLLISLPVVASTLTVVSSALRVLLCSGKRNGLPAI